MAGSYSSCPYVPQAIPLKVSKIVRKVPLNVNKIHGPITFCKASERLSNLNPIFKSDLGTEEPKISLNPVDSSTDPVYGLRQISFLWLSFTWLYFLYLY